MNKVVTLVFFIFIVVVAGVFVMKGLSGSGNNPVRPDSGEGSRIDSTGGGTVSSTDPVSDPGIDVTLTSKAVMSSGNNGVYELVSGTAMVDVHGSDVTIKTPQGDLSTSGSSFTVTVDEDDKNVYVVVYDGKVSFSDDTIGPGWILIAGTGRRILLKKPLSGLPDKRQDIVTNVTGIEGDETEAHGSESIQMVTGFLSSVTGKEGSAAASMSAEFLDVDWEKIASLFDEMRSLADQDASGEDVSKKLEERGLDFIRGLTDVTAMMRKLGLPQQSLGIVGSLGRSIQNKALTEEEKKTIGEISRTHTKEMQQLKDMQFEFELERSVRYYEIYERYEETMAAYGYGKLLIPSLGDISGSGARHTAGESLSDSILGSLEYHLKLDGETKKAIEPIVSRYGPGLSSLSKRSDYYRVQLRLAKDLYGSGLLNEEQMKGVKKAEDLLLFTTGGMRVQVTGD